MRLRTHAGFRLFWTASTVSDFGTPITTLAIQVLVVTTLSGSAGWSAQDCPSGPTGPG